MHYYYIIHTELEGSSSFQDGKNWVVSTGNDRRHKSMWTEKEASVPLATHAVKSKGIPTHRHQHPTNSEGKSNVEMSPRMIHDNLQDGKKAAAQRHPPTTHLYASPTFLRDSASAQQLAQIQTPTKPTNDMAVTHTTDKQAAAVTSEAVTIAQLRERRRALGERECHRGITKGERTGGNKPALILPGEDSRRAKRWWQGVQWRLRPAGNRRAEDEAMQCGRSDFGHGCGAMSVEDGG
ncbi:hypothetical protein FB45DRAFT_878460 [Roridomyces roridus]|uniref:Uncharacterized protein n=1 Tax=Roridomyces roridus TaxID=1738132 RepID=A0AAD7F958_9AGAR|nr:hypothetical protein FB45DRAFT_878460 [Roridomyces roridus]